MIPSNSSFSTNQSQDTNTVGSIDDRRANTAWVAVQVTLWSCITVLSTVGNSLVLLCIFRSKRLRSCSYGFYGSLAGADCLAGMICSPMLLVAAMHHQWMMGNFLCHAYSALLSTSLNASIATLCLVSMDRLNAVRKPFEYRGRDTFTQTWTKRLLFIAWVHSVFWAAAPLVGWGEIIQDRATFSCKPNWSATSLKNRTYSLCLALFPFVLPVGTMVAIYCIIYRHSKKCSQMMRVFEEGRNEGAERDRQAREKALFKTVLIIIGVFAACWAPYTLTTTCKLFISQTPPDWLIQVGLIFALAGSCANPVIYTIRDKKFVHELGKLHPSLAWLLKQTHAYNGSREHLYTISYTRQTKNSTLISKGLLSISGNSSKDTLHNISMDRLDEMNVFIRPDLTKKMFNRLRESDL